MDSLELLGEKPMMPPPPKVCPVRPVPDPVPVPEPELSPPAFEPVVPELPDELEESVEVSSALATGEEQPDEPNPEPDDPKDEPEDPNDEPEDPKEEPDDPEEPNVEPEPDEPNMELLPVEVGQLRPKPPPMPPMVEPMIGCPKNPIAVGALFWPRWMGFQSSLPVIGSVYLLRRKRILLVGLISASMLGG